jgi:anthranilate phosphoribosyltransferase
MQIADALAVLVAGRSLTEDQTRDVFTRLLAGELDPAQIAALLALIQARGATVDEIVGAARVMRGAVVRVPTPAGTTIIDTCGTGGAPKAFNISTVAAIVAAAAGRGSTPPIAVAKHGNRSRSGRGSAEVLAGLGVNVDASPLTEAACLTGAGVCFCFAIHHHPAMKHAAAPRKALAFPTIFNLLGPLTNPAGADRQLIGVYHESLVEKVAQALARLGATRAMVVHGSDGLDEITTTGTTRIAHVERGREGTTVRVEVFDPASLGVPRATPDQLVARDLAHAVETAREVIAGKPGPARDIVALNAAAALLIGGSASDMGAALRSAHAALDSGAAQQTLDALIRASRE